MMSDPNRHPATIKASDIDFFVIGGQRCGSTWLYEALREHPGIYVPKNKQTYFFDSEFGKGLDWYLSHFDGADPHRKTIGEVSTGYCLPQAVPRLHSACPDAKLIMIVRNPIDRAFSYYLNRKPFTDWASFEDAIEREDSILARGRYIEQIEHLLTLYAPSRFLLLFYDDLENDEVALYNRVCQFLDVDPSILPSVLGDPVHANSFPRLREISYRYGFSPLMQWLNQGIVGRIARRILRHRSQSKRSRAMLPETRERLVAYFDAFNKRLGEYSDRNLEHWK